MVPSDASLVKTIRSLLLNDSREMTIPFPTSKQVTEKEMNSNEIYTCKGLEVDSNGIHSNSEHPAQTDTGDEESTRSEPSEGELKTASTRLVDASKAVTDPGKSAHTSSNKRPRSQSNSSNSSSSSDSSALDSKNSTDSSSSSSSSSLSDMES